MNCQYCKNEFSSKSALNNHIKTAKYCLKLQNKGINKNNIKKCSGCGKIFSTKFNFQRHIQSCDKIEYTLKIFELKSENNNLINKLDEKDSIIESLKLQIKELQDKLENIAIKAVQRPTSTTTNKTQINNFIQKMEPISSEYLIEHAPRLTLDHIKKGASGYAEYALEGPLKDRVACVDYSRRKIKFKDKEGNVITDPEMAKLAPMFFESIKGKSSELIYSQNTPDMDSAMFEEVAKLFNTNSDVKNGSTGIKSDFYHDFVKHVCSGSLIE
jgi:hypothetical protein